VRRLVDGICFPDLCSVAHAQSNDAAAKTAAGIGGIDGARFLPRGDAYVDVAVVNGGRAGEQCGLVVFDALLPQQAAGLGFERIKRAGEISEQ
jgi:hypothetical protein